MRVKMMMTALAAAAMLAGGAQAQTPPQVAPEGGEYRGALERMINETAGGTCPVDLMAAELLAACNGQVAQMSGALQALGPITSMRFMRAVGEGAERTEVYAVQFEGGMTLAWGIGGLIDGKFTNAYAE